MIEENKELRPCPFCGEPPTVDVMGQIYCNNKPTRPHGEGCRIFAKGVLYGWNSAWCWKEIDRLKSQNQRMLSVCHYATNKFIKRQWNEIEVLAKEALKEVKE